MDGCLDDLKVESRVGGDEHRTMSENEEALTSAPSRNAIGVIVSINNDQLDQPNDVDCYGNVIESIDNRDNAMK